MAKKFTENNEKNSNINSIKKTQNKKPAPKNISQEGIGLKSEITCISGICLSLLLIISIFFNGAGVLGGIVSSFLKGLFGIGAYILPIISICFCVAILFAKEKKINVFKFTLFIISFITTITFFHIISKDNTINFHNYFSYLLNEYQTAHLFDGGIIGAIIGDILLKGLGVISSCILLFVIFLATVILLTGKSFNIFIKKTIKNLSNHFYYEYSVNEGCEEEFDLKEEGRKSIINILKEKIFSKNQNEFEDDYNEFEDDLQPNHYLAKNTKILKKQRNFIYDGNDRYIKIDKPKFLHMTEESSEKANGELTIAINEINKAREQKFSNINRNKIPEFLSQEGIRNRYKAFDEKNKDFKEKEIFNIESKAVQKLHKLYDDKNDLQKGEANFIKDNNFQCERQFNQNDSNVLNTENLSIPNSEFMQNSFTNKGTRDKIRTRVFKREDFSDYINGETIYSIDFDIPSRKEIEELFSIPPEEALSENIDFKELEKIDNFYDFNNELEQEEICTTVFDEIDLQAVNSRNDNYINMDKYEDGYIKNQMNQENFAIEENQMNQENFEIEENQVNQGNFLMENQTHQEKEPTIIKAEKQKILKEAIVEEKKEYQFPKLSFLNKNPNIENNENDIELRENSNILVKTLKSFNVNAQVINISKGPSVTRYELAIEDGIKVSKILGLSDNLALSLAASSIRIEAPIPGKSAVGIEIPNKEVKSVFLSEVICSEKFQKFPSKVSFGIGKDITGNVIVTDIAKMPHMLVAGATGSGKSVCINTIITSILYKASPDEVKLMMIDPKVVELSVYNGIPHLLTPVVTEPEKAAGVLNWAVSEMMERYNLFAQTGTRNLIGYNELKKESGENALPQIIIIIDELADLMMVAAKEVEASICRLAQLARAAGIHLIIATQRPSVDVITGLIKANVPSRIAFAVSSGTDSRTVIDSVGAEKLLGKGDMLFKAVDMNKPLRIQGAFVSDKEVESIVTFIKQNSQVNYDQSIIKKIENSVKSNDLDGDMDSDELTEDVISFLVRKGKASTSMIQRQFRIGYNRAARIIEDLEDRGIISPENGSKQRDVLMDKYQYEEYLNRYDSY